MRRALLSLVACSIAVGCVAYLAQRSGTQSSSGVVPAGGQSSDTPGALIVLDDKGRERSACPLKHTAVKAEISGFLSRVTVTQEFHNPFQEKIEAVYTFPLPQNAAVDDMTMQVGARTVRGKIMKREEARVVYEAARDAGQAASLLDQERPNIFTQSVANILPGEEVKIVVSYVETLKYDEGTYEFVFPMVVGPRYVPGGDVGKQAGGYDTDRVPDASRITPQVTPKGTRAGHDVSLEVTLDAGVPIDDLRSTLHEIAVERPSERQAVVRLKNQNEIPNKDFILKYDVAGKKLEDAMLIHRDERGGFFTMILQPPDRVTERDVMPKELVFVIDTSGSMSGFPIEKAKESMKAALDNLYSHDTFNLITFAGDTHVLFPRPVPATRENLAKAQAFLESRSGGGGTEMMKAIRAALEPSDAQDHVRIVCFMTDGYVGNDMEIISEIQKHPNARVFSFGVGNSVNRYLLDKMAEAGRGEVEYVTLQDDGSAAAKRFHERIRNPLLTDIQLDWGGLPVADIYPKRIPDVFSAKPVVIHGRFTGKALGTLKLNGRMSGRDAVRELKVDFPEVEPRHDVLATLWARTRIDDLMNQDLAGAQRGEMKQDLKETVTQLGLEYRLLTQYTSFVAVEELIITDGGPPRRVEVPVEMPDGVSREGVFGKDQDEAGANGRAFSQVTVFAKLQPAPSSTSEIVTVTGGGGGKMKRRASTGQSVGMGSNKPAAKTPTEKAYVKKESEEKVASIDGKQINELPEPADKTDRPTAPKPDATLGKLHEKLVAVVERLKRKDAKPTDDEAKFVKNDKAEIQVWLADTKPETLEALKKLGFEVLAESKAAKMLIGRLPIEKLEELAKLQGVRYVSPSV